MKAQNSLPASITETLQLDYKPSDVTVRRDVEPVKELSKISNKTKIKNDLIISFADNLQGSGLDSVALKNTVNEALYHTYDYLKDFRYDAKYTRKLKTAFGNNFNQKVADKLFKRFAKSDFTNIPNIKIVNRADIAGANSAFSADTGLIYVAVDFIAQEHDMSNLADTLLEEIGHFVDSKINKNDAAGDEGDIFARLVQGQSIRRSELAILKAENDMATATVDGQVVEIEKNDTPRGDNVSWTGGWWTNWEVSGTIYGTNNADWIGGREGNDTIWGYMGNDSLKGEEDNDELYGEIGNDTLEGGSGDDKLYGEQDNDQLWGDSGNDYLDGDSGNDTLDGGSGNDVIIGKLDDPSDTDIIGDTLIGGAGNDTLWAADKNDSLMGDAGNDYIDARAGNDTLNGGAGNDTLIGGAGSDRFHYINLDDSLLNSFDVITDFNATEDTLRVYTGRTGLLFNAVSVTSLDTAGITAKLTNTNFKANFAAQFAFGSRTFVAINDATAGFQANTDAIIEVTGLSGTLTINNFTTTF